jgi:hypothetical protein
MKNLLDGVAVSEVEMRMARLRPESERRWGKMNAHQMVCHLADSFDVGLGKRYAAPVKTPLPPPVMKWLALQLPMQWPKGVPTTSVAEQGGGGTPPEEWPRDYQRLLEVFHAFCAKREAWPQHPFFREMSATDWMRWGYLHSDHHLRQFGV